MESHLPYAVTQQIVECVQSKKIELRDSPKKVKYHGENYYIVSQSDPLLIIREDGLIVEPNLANEIFHLHVAEMGFSTRTNPARMFFFHLLFIIVGLVLGLIISLTWELIIEDFILPKVSGYVFYEDYDIVLFFMGLALFLAYYIWQGMLLFFFPKYNNLRRLGLLKWRLLIPFILLNLYLPLFIFANGSYLIVTENGIYQSSFWKLDDKKHFKWSEIKSSKLTAEKTSGLDMYDIYLYLRMKNNTTIQLDPLTQEYGFIQITEQLRKTKIPITTTTLSPFAIESIDYDYGYDISQLFIKKQKSEQLENL